MNYWLMKSEPEAFSIDSLIKNADQTTHWDGVRNYQARNMMRDQMKKGDRAFFYHSNTSLPGIVGIVEVVNQAYPDFTATDPTNIHYDPKSSMENPRWFMVDVKFVRKLKRIITLAELKENPLLKQIPVVKKGNRLSIMPVNKEEWQAILAME